MLWLLAGDSKVKPILPTIERERGPVLVSAVSIWEVAIKSAVGKLRVPEDLPDQLDQFAFERLPVTGAHAWAVRSLPPLHGDPFDRLLVGQALCEQATIVSADDVFDRYGVRRVW